MTSPEPTRTKIARRVVDLLEYFDADHPQASVTDLVNRFDWPQSSTSELLTSLVDLGLLYKEPRSRRYWPTPRAALIGTGAQPAMLRDGSLIRAMDALGEQTGLTVGVFGLSDLAVQIYHWRAGEHRLALDRRAALHGASAGKQDCLPNSAAGLMLLSTIDQPKRDRMIRHINAEAPDDRKFAASEVAASVQRCRDLGHAAGSAGFGIAADMLAVLLPGLPEERPMAIGFVYARSDHIDDALLLRTLQDRVARLGARETAPAAAIPLQRRSIEA